MEVGDWKLDHDSLQHPISNFQLPIFNSRIRFDDREKNFVEKCADTLKQARVFFVAGARTEFNFEHRFQNQLAKMNRRARGIARRNPACYQRATVLARDLPTRVEQLIVRVGVFGKINDRCQQALSKFALMCARLLIGTNRRAFEPIRMWMRAQLLAHERQRLFGWICFWLGGFSLLNEEFFQVSAGEAAMTAWGAITLKNTRISPLAHRANVRSK